jgi:adenine-specific DNA-methyltransferase
MNLYNTLEQQLKKEPNFVTDIGELKKWVVLNKAQNFDEELLGLLLENADLKDKFFVNVKGTLVFNQNLFVQFLEQKNYLNDSYTQFKNKVGLTIDGKYLKQRNEVALVWPFKDCVLEGGQNREEDKREEIFFNEILAQDEITQLLEPKVLTNTKRFNKDGEKPLEQFNRNEQGTITDNLIVRGNNLLALYTLKKEFAGKVKLIYIDPPYNTGNDTFRYNDNFNHSTWLTFMLNRLTIAKEMLSDDGVIFVQCDDSEQEYLKIILDQVFGSDSHQVTLYIQVRYEGKSLAEKNDYQKLIEQIFVFSKGNFRPIKDQEEYTTEKFCWNIKELTAGTKVSFGGKQVTIFKKGEYVIERLQPNQIGLKETWASGTVLKNNASGKFFGDHIASRIGIDGLEVLYKVEGIGEDGLGYRYFTGPKKQSATKGKFYSGIPLIRQEELSQGSAIKEKSISNFYNYADAFGNCRHEGGVELRSGKKPETLLKRIIEIGSKEGDLIMDYHLGTGTTAAVSLKMNRRFIGIEQLDYGKNDSINRLNNVINGDKTGISEIVNWKGGGSFVYIELKKFNQTFITQIEEAKDSKTLLIIWEQMKAKSFLNYNVDIKKQDEHLEEFKALSLAEQKQHLCELLDKNQLYVNLSSLNDADFACTEEEKKVTKDFYQINK